MIETKNINKSFDDIKAVNEVTLSINEKCVFGLIGTNGAGKSTFLRMLAGILKPDSGEIFVDGESVYENTFAKKKIFYISDEQYFFSSATPLDMVKFYSEIYTGFEQDRFKDLLEKFHLEQTRKINTFSKGMKKLLSILLGVCSGAKYLLCDESFDGLDPVMRQGIKRLFAAEIEDREFTPIIASHNLRELEDICDHIGLLHQGGVILSKDLIDMKDNIHKVQFVTNEGVDLSPLDNLEIVSTEKRGSLSTIIARGNRDKILETIGTFNPIFVEALPLSLEEIFISETGEVGYEIKNLIF